MMFHVEQWVKLRATTPSTGTSAIMAFAINRLDCVM
jgi:hypothetical protein